MGREMTKTCLLTATAATLLALATPLAQAAEPAADASGQPAASSNSPNATKPKPPGVTSDDTTIRNLPNATTMPDSTTAKEELPPGVTDKTLSSGASTPPAGAAGASGAAGTSNPAK
jgi:hypothetical protein